MISSQFRSRIGGSVALICLLIAAKSTIAAGRNEATITQIVNDVRLLSEQGATHAAVINDKVPNDVSLQTGTDSRAELTFADQTLARLSANTRFSYNEGVRDLDLADGAVLVCVPKRAGNTKISMAAATVAISDATAIVEYHPHAYLKVISLEGTLRLYLKRRWGESVLVRPGQMVITNPDGKHLADPVDVDLARLMRTSLLIVNFPVLSSQGLIAKESEKQQSDKSKRRLIDTNLVIFGKGTVVSLTNPALTGASNQKTVPVTATRADTIPSSSDIGTIETPKAGVDQ